MDETANSIEESNPIKSEHSPKKHDHIKSSKHSSHITNEKESHVQNQKFPKGMWWKILVILIGGLTIETGVIMINTSFKVLSGFLIVIGVILLFYGILKLK
jgi:hypothetical protein